MVTEMYYTLTFADRDVETTGANDVIVSADSEAEARIKAYRVLKRIGVVEGAAQRAVLSAKITKTANHP